MQFYEKSDSLAEMSEQVGKMVEIVKADLSKRLKIDVTQPLAVFVLD